MIESIFNFIFSLNDLWRPSSDPLVTECRGYQKRILGWSLLSVVLIMFTIFLSPTDATSPLIYTVFQTISLAMFVGSLVFFILVLINVYDLYLFFKRNGFYE